MSGHTEGTGGAAALLFVLIGGMGAVGGAAAADASNYGQLETAALIVGGFIGIIILFIIAQLALITLGQLAGLLFVIVLATLTTLVKRVGILFNAALGAVRSRLRR